MRCFPVLLRKGGPLPFLCIGCGRRRRVWREMREAEEDGTSKRRPTGQEELGTKPDWQRGCCSAPLLLTTGEREAEFVRSDLWPVARLTAAGGRSERLKVRPPLKSTFASSGTEGPCKDQRQRAQARTALDPSTVSSPLPKCCGSVGTAAQRCCAGCVRPQPRPLLAAQSQLRRWPVPGAASASLGAAAAERAPRGALGRGPRAK